jgi:hypothetical protein
MIKSILPLITTLLTSSLVAQSQKELVLTIPNAQSLEIMIPNAQLDTIYWEKPYPKIHTKITAQCSQALLDNLVRAGVFQYTLTQEPTKTTVTQQRQPQLVYQLKITLHLPQTTKTAM